MLDFSIKKRTTIFIVILPTKTCCFLEKLPTRNSRAKLVKLKIILFDTNHTIIFSNYFIQVIGTINCFFLYNVIYTGFTHVVRSAPTYK